MPTLYVVATPIGNLQDITLRALDKLRSADLIICEDTRVTVKLLNHFDIKKPLYNYQHHSTVHQVNKLVILIEQSQSAALVTDAGTPGIQDPGNKLIYTLVSRGLVPNVVNVVPVPGPSALTALISVSGLPGDDFLFLGFLPKKKGRQQILREIISARRTVIFYESGHRIVKTFSDLRALSDEIVLRQIVVGCELTKKFEVIYRGQLGEIVEKIEQNHARGEYAVLIAPAGW